MILTEAAEKGFKKCVSHLTSLFLDNTQTYETQHASRAG